MKKHWVLNSWAEGAKRVAEEFDLHPAVASILLRRGLRNSPEIFSFLNASLETLQSPWAFSQMPKAVQRIRQAITRGEKILIYGDYDVDGITGSAILYPVLKKIGADVEVHIPHRMEEGYGLNLESLAKLLKEKPIKLVITVDNGITGIQQVDFLNSNGVDVIIVDHHTPKDETPRAFAIISAAAGDKSGEPNLAACGVAFKLGWALLGDLEPMKEYLDLVTVGTIADLAPVLGDNRILLKHGLEVLGKTKRPGLRALMTVAAISRKAVTYRDIAFGLGPRINASGRMGSPQHAFDLLTTEDPVEAKRLAEFLDGGNRDRQRVEAKAFQDAAKVVEKNRLEESSVLVVASPEWHEGVLGIVASRLVERFQKPSIVISLKEEMGKGSGRSIPSFSLFDSVLTCEDLLINFGGHAQACGLTIHKDKIDLFRQRLNESSKNFLQWDKRIPLEIESELPLAELDLKFLKDLERLAPFGPGHQKPLFLSKGLRLKGEAKKRGKDTLQCWMTDKSGKTTCEVIGFRSYERWTSQKQEAYDIVHQPTLKDFNGIPSIQLELEDWH